MSRLPPRISPLESSEWTEAARDVFGAISRRPETRTGTSSNILLTLAHHPDLALPYLNFSRHLLMKLSLPARVRELTTLRVAHLYNSDYEWTQHVGIAQVIGITLDEIEAVKAGTDHPGWSELERCAIRSVDEMRANAKVGDHTWDRLAHYLDKRQLMELLFSIGHYIMLSMVMNSLGVEPEAEKLNHTFLGSAVASADP